MNVTPVRLRAVLDYDPETGWFTWRLRLGPHCVIGSRAGSDGPGEYRSIRIDGELYLEHRLAWLYVYGVQPPTDLDHKNQRKGENWIANLRLASKSQNRMNTTVRSDSGTGIKGVSFEVRAGKYRASICREGKGKFLGYFDDPVQAGKAYNIAAAQLFGEFAGT